MMRPRNSAARAACPPSPLQEARLRPLLAQGEHDSAAALMQGALRLASLETAVAGPSGLGGCASGGGQSANHGCSAPPHDPSLLQQQQQQQQQACNADEQGQGRQQVPAASTQQLAVAPSPQAQQAGQAAHRGEQQAQPAWPEQAAQAATLSPGCAHPPPPVPPSPQPQPEQQAQQQPQPERQPQQEQEQQQEQQPLLDLLLDAAEAPVPAAAGLSHELAAAFLSLPEQQQAAKAGTAGAHEAVASWVGVLVALRILRACDPRMYVTARCDPNPALPALACRRACCAGSSPLVGSGRR